MFERILMMTDLTETSRRAYGPVLAMAKRNKGCRVLLAHSVLGSTEQYFVDKVIRDKIDANARAKAHDKLVEAAEELSGMGVNVEPVLEIGSPFNVLPALVEKFDAELVVLPTRSEHSMVRRISNSVTARAIRDHVVPVLTVNDHFDPKAWAGFSPVVHPVAFGDSQRSGLITAEDFAAATRSPLQLLHVLQPLNLLSIYDDDAHELARVIEQSQDDLAERVEAGMADVLKKVTRVSGSVHVTSHNNAGEGIVAYLHESGAGMVILPALGRDAVHTQLMGSVAEHVIRYAPCPVLVYDRPLFDEPKSA